MAGVRRNRGTWGGLGSALAALALLVQVLVPQGFMTSRDVGGVLPLVICTGHGPLLLAAPDLGGPAKAPKTSAHDSCLFAGHGPALSPALAITIAEVSYRFAAPAIRGMEHTPPLGLAAPPPPAQAPPPEV